MRLDILEQFLEIFREVLADVLVNFLQGLFRTPLEDYVIGNFS